MSRGTGRPALLVVALVVAGAASVVACTESERQGETPARDSGISGTVILGPTCSTGDAPGAHEPVPCLTPYSAQLAVLDGENVVVVRATSDADGRFRVTLPPGDYVVAPQGGDPYPIAQPIPVSVPAGEYVEIQINYDTGIR